jgi:protein-S-isoprenylcysteine O-methyltransferase Ste14
MLKFLSILGLIVMVGGAVGLLKIGVLFSPQLVTIVLQVIAIALLVWARITFGRRSFHAAANPTEGGLVTSGPYRYIRHPIYTAACLFCWASIITHLSLITAAFGLMVFLGSITRMLAEERLVQERYPQYLEYSKKTKRMLPGVF